MGAERIAGDEMGKLLGRDEVAGEERRADQKKTKVTAINRRPDLRTPLRADKNVAVLPGLKGIVPGGTEPLSQQADQAILQPGVFMSIRNEVPYFALADLHGSLRN